MILPTDIVPLSPMSGGDLDLIRLSSAAPIQPASGLSATRINPGYALGLAWPTHGFTLRGSFAALVLVLAIYGLIVVLP